MHRVVTYHAIRRWLERIETRAVIKGIGRRVRAALLESVELTGPLLWAYLGEQQLGEQEFLRHPATGAVFACVVDRDRNQLVAVTVLPPDRPVPKPRTGWRHDGAKYKGRMDIQPYKRQKRLEMEDE